VKGGRKARPGVAGGVSSADRPELYRRRAIDRRPGYRSAYGETTKRASDASDFIPDAPAKHDGVGEMRSETAGLVYSLP
jgi:hypothetical protein